MRAGNGLLLLPQCITGTQVQSNILNYSLSLFSIFGPVSDSTVGHHCKGQNPLDLHQFPRSKMPSFVNISTITNRNFCKKIYTANDHIYLRITAKYVQLSQHNI